jgi:hypothetical protein
MIRAKFEFPIAQEGTFGCDLGAANKGSLAAKELLLGVKVLHDDSPFAVQRCGEDRAMSQLAEAEGVLCG